MKRSEAINELAAALAKAQPAFEAAGRDHKAKVETKTGGYYEFNYADFAAYLDVCRKPLGEQGLSFTQEAVTDNQLVSVTTLLMHTSGQWIETAPLTLPLIPDSRGAVTAQIIGSGITYAKRYSLSSLIGLASEADDDGNQASGNQAETTKRVPKPNCPKCENNTHVYEDRQKGGFFCWKQKGGCGHNWLPADEHKPSEADATAKAEAERIAAEHGMATADKLPSKGKAEQLPRPDKSAVFESWATFILAITPNSFDEDLGAIRQTIKDGKVKAPHVEPILRAAAKRAETAGQFDILDRLLLPLKETIRADDEGWTKLAIDIDEQRGIKLGDPVTA